MKRRIALFAVFVFCTACYGWRHTDVPNSTSGEASIIEHPIRVELHAGPEIKFERARVERDTLFGTDSEGRQAAIALSDMRTIRERRFSPLRTAGAAVASVAAVMLYLFLKLLFSPGVYTSTEVRPVFELS